MIDPNGIDSEKLPLPEVDRGDIALGYRFPEIVLPRDPLWPVKLHDKAVLQTATDTLPGLVAALAKPIEPASKDKLRGVFANNPHQRRMPWRLSEGADDTYTFSTAAYEGVPNAGGSTPLYYGINYQFDQHGRMIKREYVEGERSYQSHQPNFQEFLTYDEAGYLTKRITWGYIEPTITDHFDYEVDNLGHKTPKTMTRTIKVSDGSHQTYDSLPMAVDLANYEKWLMTNPNGFTAIEKEELSPKELEISEFDVSERRRGVSFAHPEHLEHALIMYGTGDYSTPGGQTALEHNEKSFEESPAGALGSMLFSMAVRGGDMGKFVRSSIMEKVDAQWKAVQKSKQQDAAESVRFSFDYDGVGHFHKSGGTVSITKQGLVLEMYAAYVGDEVEDQLASALGKKRGLQTASIEIPINQTEREGYFFVDLKAACQKLGLPVSEAAITEYLREYLGETDPAPKSSYERQYGSRPSLYEDAKTGVTVDLVTKIHDHDADIDLDTRFGHDATSIWGPLPKNIRGHDDAKKSSPKLRVVVKPAGDPFDDLSAQVTDATLKDYIHRLEGSRA